MAVSNSRVMLEIKLYITIAMILYALSFISSRKYFKFHIISAAIGFTLDMYATYLMETLRVSGGITFSGYPHILKFHTVISLIAVFAFLLQMILGIFRKGKAHIISAKYFFLPAWFISWASGIYLLF